MSPTGGRRRGMVDNPLALAASPGTRPSSARPDSRRARLANWRTAVLERPMTALISSKGYPNTSCRTNAARSAGTRASSTTRMASPVFSASKASASGSAEAGSGGARASALAQRRARRLVQDKPRHDGREPGRQVVDAVGAGEPNPGLLHDVVRIGL